MTTINLKDTRKEFFKKSLESYLHYGNVNKNWNPKMAPYILFHNKEGFHIFDIIYTRKCLEIAAKLLAQMSQENKNILFVGTTKETSTLVMKYALKSGSFYLSYRWLGGMLTNWMTIQKRIEQLKYLENIQSSSELLKTMSKKEQSKLYREIFKLQRLFTGIKDMKSLPDVIIFADQDKDILGVYETLKLGIPAIAIIDCESNPDLVAYPIPANNKSIFSIEFMMDFLAKTIIDNKKN